MNILKDKHKRRGGFTLVELLLVISVIAIMGALAVSQFSNASQDTRRVIARQQQATLQTAVNAWVASEISGLNTVEDARLLYNEDGGTARTFQERLEDLIQPYLDEETMDHFTDHTTNNTRLQTHAMVKLGWWLELPTWQSSSYPKVSLIKS